MNIALIGYGRMGREIENIALKREHEIPLIIDIDNLADINNLAENKIDVAIEFTTPKTAVSNIMSCVDQKVPVISGTTGWQDEYDKVEAYCQKNEGTFLSASNFSLGVNLFFKLNKWLAAVMKGQQNYHVSLEETHHTDKLDKPSGTAITLANQLLDIRDELDSWSLKQVADNQLSIIARREAGVPGIHAITYESPTDKIQIKHLAKSREGFALGAVLVSEWIINQSGVLTMDDFLNFN